MVERKKSGGRSRIPAFYKQQTVRPHNKPDRWIDPNCNFKSDLEARFAQLWVELYPSIDLNHEYQFLEDRRFRFDFCHLASKVAIEIQGGIHMTIGRHNSGSGLQSEYEKAQLASKAGWTIVPLSAANVEDADVLEMIAKTIESRMVKAA